MTMASKYQEAQRSKQIKLINESNIFGNVKGGGYFRKVEREFVLRESLANLYEPIRESVQDYMKVNNISWWGGKKPTGHMLSSQIACLNHLFHIRNDGDAVLAILNNVRDEFVEVLPLPCDKMSAYIGFEVVSGEDYLNEKQSTRGSNCTSIDAFIYARHKSGKMWLISIEWKYTEHYQNSDKSTEDRAGVKNKGLNYKGDVRLKRYSSLIDSSKQLKTLEEYRGSVYFQEPFYQLMRQTLWAEQVVAHKESSCEPLKADNYLHIHIIPQENSDLLDKRYKVTGEGMEKSWRACIEDQSKYVIVSPAQFLSPLESEHKELTEYLRERYW